MKEFNFDVDLDSIVASATDNNADNDDTNVNERERTMESYNLYDFDATRAQGFYQMPIITKTKYVPVKEKPKEIRLSIYALPRLGRMV